MRHYLAIDIGASSGRHIVGWSEGGTVQTKEVYRFPNGVTERNGHLTWDMDALLGHVRAGIDKALDEFGTLDSFPSTPGGAITSCSKGTRRSGPVTPTGTTERKRWSRRFTRTFRSRSSTPESVASSSLSTPFISSA